MPAPDTLDDATVRPDLAPAPSRLPADAPEVVRVTVVTAPEPQARPAGFVHRNRTVILYAALLLITDRAAGWFAPVWDGYSPDEYAARVEGCAREQRDVVFVGGSPVAEGIDPARIAGVMVGEQRAESVYAVGLSGGTTSDFYHGVLRACPTPPRVLVYGITASDLNDSRHEPHGPYSLMTWGDLGRWVRLRPESAGWVTRHFLRARLGQASDLYRYRHGMRMWAATEADAIVPGCCPEATREAAELRQRADALRDGNGYVPAAGYSVGRYDRIKAAGLSPGPFSYLDKYRTGSHLKYLHRLREWCAGQGTAFVLIDMPVTADLEARYPAAWAEYRDRLAELEREGLRVVRATREAVGLGDEHFADLIHLNRDGAAKLSEWVRTELAGGP